MDCEKYLKSKKIDCIVDKLIGELLLSKPDDPIPLMLHVLEGEVGEEVPALSRKEEVELMHLKARWK